MNPVNILASTARGAFSLVRRTAGKIVSGLPSTGGRGPGEERQQAADQLDTPPVRETADRAVARERAQPDLDAEQAPEAAPGLSATTPSGIAAADPAYNPDTAEADFVQRDTPPLMDPATTKAVLSEAETLRKASERNKS